MRKLLIHAVAIFIAHYLCNVAIAAPPKVVKAVPDNGAVNINPATKEIRVTFDQPMGKGMSVVGGGEEFPEIQGRPSWINDRTVAVKVKLKPNHDYWLSINNEKFQNFTNRSGESAVPYPIKFRTGTVASSKDHDSAKSGSKSHDSGDMTNRRAIEQMQSAIRDRYSYRNRLSIDWDALFKSNEAALAAATSPTDFAKVARYVAGSSQRQTHLAAGRRRNHSDMRESIDPQRQLQNPENLGAQFQDARAIRSQRPLG